ncbi:hypothetical protein [Muricoccus roseus]|uniref:hypothetical protein n=1 Tax=Muricoccus roseus TaxID=198092 RepID=UPI001114B147|nr:hypothetical protein [Roseomonas rosea]
MDTNYSNSRGVLPGLRRAEASSRAHEPQISLSLAELYAEQDNRRLKGMESAADAERIGRTQGRSARERFDARQLTDTDRQEILSKIRVGFESGQREVTLSSWHSDFCTDGGRGVNNRFADWQNTLPAGARIFVKFWQEALRPGGFGLSSRILNFPGGVLGDVGLFVTWPETRA